MSLSGNPFDFFVAFLGGILASFTPCVYPLIPVTAGYIAVRSEGLRFKALVLSLVYVTGIAITYSILGLVASLSGTIFGRISTYPITYLFVGSIIILFAISMLDLINIPSPLIKPAKYKKGYLGVFLLGLTSGLIASPCLTPILGSILLFIAAKQKILYGTTLLLCFAYGMGLIFVLAGTFSALLVRLPKLGKWTLRIKKICGFILIAMGLYFISNGIARF